MPTVDLDRVREELDPAECRRLLATDSVGRLGFTDGALPAIVPAAYTMSDATLVIPARRGDPVVDAVRGAIVVFEVDDYDPGAMTGWSVTVVGPSRVRETADRALCAITIRVGLMRGWRVRAAG